MFTSHGPTLVRFDDHLASIPGGGFTAADLMALGEIRATTRHLWGRDQLVANEFAHYLAVWRPEAGLADPPALALARFKKTGTYMLMIGTTVVATGKRLSDVLPALPFAGGNSDRSTP
jgi:hypothetical protein